MERQIPKNVRQIGNVSDTPKIYVEDYVDTFFNQLCEKCAKTGSKPMGAFLVGDIQSGDSGDYIYIYGAIQMHELRMKGTEYEIDDSTWKHAYEDCKQFFDDGEMLGWFVVHPGAQLKPDAAAVKLHKKSFPKNNTVFIMKDPVEKDEAYFVHKMNDLMEIGGRYTYYEKNPCMQNYMISSRKKNGVFPSETVEDRAAQDFRDLARKRSRHGREKKPGSLMYAAGACMVLVIVIMGVSMLNSFDRMKSVQSTLDSLTDASASASDGSSGGDPGDAAEEPEVMETGAPVTAVPGEQQTDSGGAEDTENTENTEDTGNAEDTESADKPDGADSQSPAGAENADENGSDGVYVVEEGDTLAIISRKVYGDVNHVDAICRMNGISDGNLIYVGQKLLLP